MYSKKLKAKIQKYLKKVNVKKLKGLSHCSGGCGGSGSGSGITPIKHPHLTYKG